MKVFWNTLHNVWHFIKTLLTMIFDLDKGLSSFIKFLSLFLFTRSFIIDYFWIPTSSEAPNLFRGDCAVVKKCAYGAGLMSLTLNIGRMLLPQNDEFFDSLYGNKLLNDQIRGGKLPYLKWKTPQIGDVVTYLDPRSGYNVCKRVVGISDDVIAMHDGHIIRNGIEATWKFVESYEYRTDYGPYVLYNVYKNKLAGTEKEYLIQVLPDDTKADRRYDNMSPFIILPKYKLLTSQDADAARSWIIYLLCKCIDYTNYEKEGIYICLIGDHLHGSSDSRQGDVIPRNVPEEWITGQVIGIILSSHIYFVITDVLTNIKRSWIEWILFQPLNIAYTICGIPYYLDRVGKKVI